MDKQEKNRKPVNQGKSYKWLRPGADLYHAPHRPGNASHNLWSLWHCQKVLTVRGGAHFLLRGSFCTGFVVHCVYPQSHTNMSSIPRAVRGRYKPDRRCSSRGWEFLAPTGAGMLAQKSGLSPTLNPQAERRVSPLCGVCAAGGGGLRWKWRAEVAGQKVGPVASTWLREEECSLFPSMHQGWWHAGDRRNKTRRRKSISHAMLPSPALPHAAAGFPRIEFKERQQRQLSSLQSSDSVSPCQISSIHHLGRQPSWAWVVFCCLSRALLSFHSTWSRVLI